MRACFALASLLLLIYLLTDSGFTLLLPVDDTVVQGISEGNLMDDKLGFWQAMIAKREQAVEQRFVPSPGGYWEQVRVPDTLDLADRAALAINCLTGALDPDYGYELYFVTRFAANPAYMHHEASGLPTNNPKFAESLPMMRVASGSTQNLDIERAMMARTLALVADDGLYYAPLLGRPWHQSWDRADDDFANVYGNGRLLLALLAWYQYDGNPLWMDYAHRLVVGLRHLARVDGELACFPDPGIGEPFSYPRSGYPADLPAPTEAAFGIPMYHSGVIRALAKYTSLTGDGEALELARKLANFVRQPAVWNGGEEGHFSGHFHAHVACLRGLLEYALVAEDEELKRFVFNGYQFARGCGIPEIGWFPENTGPDQWCESCCIADMVALAIKLTDAGMGDHWEDVDRWVRNQLVEQQLIDREALEHLAAASPEHIATSPAETDDRVIERNLGGWAGHGAIATLPDTWIMHCCTGNASQALYYAWEGIVRKTGEDAAQVNLLLNRASPWLDVASWLPCEGKVVLTMKTARQVTVRVPDWVARDMLAYTVEGEPVTALWKGSYLCFGDLAPGQRIELNFPVVERFTTIHLDETPYTLRFRGNTVIGFSRDELERRLGLVEGKFVLGESGRAVVKGVEAMDAQVEVDAEAGAEAGVMLRYLDPGTFLLAIWANGGVYFHEVVGGNYGPLLDFVPATGFGPAIYLRAEVDGDQARLTVTDGEQTVTTTHTVLGLNQAGSVGLFHNRMPEQCFDNFQATDLAGEMLFADDFEDTECSQVSWEVPARRGGTEYDYPLYRRAEMLREETALVEKRMWVADSHIEG